MKAKLLKILKELNYPVYSQGSLIGAEEYPDNFFAIWNSRTESQRHYDNQEARYIWDFTISFYSIDPELGEEKLLEAKKKLKENGFVVNGKGRDAYSQSKSHFGREIEVTFIE